MDAANLQGSEVGTQLLSMEAENFITRVMDKRKAKTFPNSLQLSKDGLALEFPL